MGTIRMIKTLCHRGSLEKRDLPSLNMTRTSRGPWRGWQTDLVRGRRRAFGVGFLQMKATVLGKAGSLRVERTSGVGGEKEYVPFLFPSLWSNEGDPLQTDQMEWSTPKSNPSIADTGVQVIERKCWEARKIEP